MKVAHIVYEFPSVSETFVLAQIIGVLDRGWEVSILADGKGSHGELSSAAARLVERTKYFGLPFKGARELLGTVLSRTSGKLEPIDSRKEKTSALASMRLKLEQRAFARAGKVDLVHAHFGPNGVRAVRLRSGGVFASPIITSFYGYDVTRHWARSGYGELFKRGDLFVALSNTMKNQLVEMGAPESRTVVHRLGVDLSRFDALRESASHPLSVISIARLVEKKGIEYGIRAFAKVSRDNRDARYTIVGDGPLKSRLVKLSRDLGVADQVRFAGAQSPEQIASLLAQSHILVAPSVRAVDGDTEGTPVAILEAGAAGIPVVTTKHGSIPEIIQDSVNGYLVEERDINALAERIVELASNDVKRAQMGDAGRRFVSEHHDIRRLNDQLAMTYAQIAGTAG